MTVIFCTQLMQSIIDRSNGDFDAYTLARAVMTELHEFSQSEKIVEDCYCYCEKLSKEGKLLQLANGRFYRTLK